MKSSLTIYHYPLRGRFHIRGRRGREADETACPARKRAAISTGVATTSREIAVSLRNRFAASPIRGQRTRERERERERERDMLGRGSTAG